jgi:betaine-homocysteine S-methyltransferase
MRLGKMLLRTDILSCQDSGRKDIFMPKTTKSGLLERLDRGETVFCAEGYVFELERRGYVKAGAYVPEVVLDHPEVVSQLHREFLRAGTDVVEALTYYGHREKLKAIGRENDLELLNRQALRLAKQAARGTGALVAGNICNTWAYDASNPVASGKLVRDQYTEQVGWAKTAGVDFIIAETIEYLGEALVAVEVVKSFGLPVVLNFGAADDKTKDGYDWMEACRTVKQHGADVVGFNCMRGPATLLPLLRQLRDAIPGPIAALPVPYRTNLKHPAFQFLQNEDSSSAYTLGLDKFLCTRQEMAEFAIEAQRLGVGFIGICCGAGPHHVRAMTEALGRTVPSSRYSPDLSEHAQFGSAEFVKPSERRFASRH